MSNISSVFHQLKGKCAFIPFVTAGHPSLDITEEVLRILDKNGADIIEIGLPYSDPLADGPIIQEASSRALNNGITFDIVINMLQRVVPSLNTPLVLFTYYNPIITRGVETFVSTIANVGIKGLLVPDLPLEESEFLLKVTKQYNIEMIMLVAPTSPIARVEAIAKIATGCIYLVSNTGVTGSRESFALNVRELVKQIKSFTDVPIIIGFGISTPEHIRQVKQWGVEGIVMGSAFVKILLNQKHDYTSEIKNLCITSKQAVDEPN
uniref:Tryptophan synthase alpha chain n=1 Tax=Porphyridium sordidum TaxID=28024 RepID=A0A1C9CDZ0_PORSO|nr:tryptophan synthase alpha subunit [Porphyridium sordidum]AOM66577.1 tryptophan synthase alpha subunit [Porphyridium sordidum]